MTKVTGAAQVAAETATTSVKNLNDLITKGRTGATGSKAVVMREVLDGVIAAGQPISKAEIIKLVTAKLPVGSKVYHSEIDRVILSYNKPEVK